MDRTTVAANLERRPVPEPGQGAQVDRFEEPPRLSRREDRRRALGDDVLLPPGGWGGVHREHLADDERMGLWGLLSEPKRTEPGELREENHPGGTDGV